MVTKTIRMGRVVYEYGLSGKRWVLLRILCGFMWVLMGFVSPIVSTSWASGTIPDTRAINAIIGEAEGEGAVGMEAVACAIRNRGHLKGVYGEKAPRVVKRLYSDKIYILAKSAWVVSENVSRCDKLVHGATHWEGTAFKTPYWAKSMSLVATVGNQRFYR
jgi:hypothetical protein